MKGVLYSNTNKEVIKIVENVTSVGPDFVIGSSEVRGINTETVSYIVIEDNIPVNVGDTLPEDLRDYSGNFREASLDECVQALTEEKAVLEKQVGLLEGVVDFMIMNGGLT